MKQTFLNSGGIIILSLLGIMLFFVKKNKVFIPIIITVCFMTYGQSINLGGFNLYFYRIILLILLARVLIRGEFRYPIWNKIDIAVMLWLTSNVVLNIILWSFSYEAIKNRLGLIYDVVLIYGLFRIVIDDYSQIENIIKFTAILVLPLAVIMLYESNTGFNLFSYFGGVSGLSEVRHGRVRCNGPFRHPILAGTFGATTLPFFIALLASKKEHRILSYIGIISSLAIIYASSSSGPLMAFVFSIIGFLFWFVRDGMKKVRWMILLSLIFLHFYMKAPVWYLIARVSNITGGGGWHRSYLINQAVDHIDEWWLLGTRSTAHWFPYTLAIDPTSSDITNQYIGNGTDAGILTMILFILIMVRCFQALGFAQNVEVSHPLGKRFCIWAIGVSLLVHLVSFFSVSYFDQNNIVWFLLLAMIATMFDIHHRASIANVKIEVEDHLYDQQVPCQIHIQRGNK